MVNATNNTSDKSNFSNGEGVSGARLNAVFGPIEVHLAYLIDAVDGYLKGAVNGVRKLTPEEQREVNARRKAVALRFAPCAGGKTIREKICGLQEDLGLFADEMEEISVSLSQLNQRFADANLKEQIDANGLEVSAENLTRLHQALCVALKKIRYLVTPFEFNDERLKPSRVGVAIDFNKDYEKELNAETGEDLRPAVLKKLHDMGEVYGLVDVEHGMVYRISETWGEYWSRVALAAALPFLGFAAVLILCAFNLLDMVIPPLSDDSPLAARGGLAQYMPVVYYFICLAGYVAHIAKKLVEAAGNDPLVSDVVHWVEIKAWSFASLGVSLWVVFGMLMWQHIATMRPQASVLDLDTALIAFAAGYFVDSFAEPLLKQFERKVSASKSQLEALIRPAA